MKIEILDGTTENPLVKMRLQCWGMLGSPAR